MDIKGVARPGRSLWRFVGVSFAVLVVLVTQFQFPERLFFGDEDVIEGGNRCKDHEAIFGKPAEHLAKVVFGDDELRDAVSKKLGNAIRIGTEMTDFFPPPAKEGEEETFDGWKPFSELHKQLEKDFPLVWKHLEVETVNRYSLLLTWKGSDESLKPNLFSAHMDVVPVSNATLDQWEHGPYSGDFDGKYIWGRGSIDDKNMLIGMLQAVELILKEDPDFKPTRTLLLGFGSDEESSGRYGAKEINTVLLERYGHKGIYSIVDEGGMGVLKVADVWIASPSTAEKGFLNLEFQVITPGGHSSFPPDHTAIGIASEFVHEIESSKFPLTLTEENPIAQLLTCFAENSKVLPSSIKKDIRRMFKDPKAKQRLLQMIVAKVGRLSAAFFRTTEAVDVFRGGVKGNVLPEDATFVVNHRIAVDSSVDAILEKASHHARFIAEKYGLGLVIRGETIIPVTPAGSVNLNTRQTIDVAPVSPDNEVWDEFAGLVKGFFDDVVFPNIFADSSEEVPSVVVAPSVMIANTDSVNYWNLTENIYRFQPALLDKELVSHIHSLNEHIDIDSLMYVVGFYYNYIHRLQQH